MAISIRQLIIGIAAVLAITGVGIGVISGAIALAPATERAQHADSRYHGSPAPFAGRLSDHQQLRRIFIDEARERLR